jgi:hypothetical protein
MSAAIAFIIGIDEALQRVAVIDIARASFVYLSTSGRDRVLVHQACPGGYVGNLLFDCAPLGTGAEDETSAAHTCDANLLKGHVKQLLSASLSLCQAQVPSQLHRLNDGSTKTLQVRCD